MESTNDRPPAFLIREASNGGFIVFDEYFNEPFDIRYTSKSAAARAVLSKYPEARVIGLDRSILVRIRRELGQMFGFARGRAVTIDHLEYEFDHQIGIYGAMNLAFDIYRPTDHGRIHEGRLYVPGYVPRSGEMGFARLVRLIRQELKRRAERVERERIRTDHLFSPYRSPV